MTTNHLKTNTTNSQKPFIYIALVFGLFLPHLKIKRSAKEHQHISLHHGGGEGKTRVNKFKKQKYNEVFRNNLNTPICVLIREVLYS